ncbi:hypothetical protein CRI93_12270 [Longimonas halophila]|uniref:DUF2281 domain-containing protein n=1 Tax=Longimonas halophila TaxID=1469170 RepID=A0A2H3NJ81_9BACT|nr:hypothetical protein CRI93_12270 [Longimonas halophila]
MPPDRDELLAVWEQLSPAEKRSVVDFATFLRKQSSAASEEMPHQSRANAAQRVRDALSDMPGTLSDAIRTERSERV